MTRHAGFTLIEIMIAIVVGLFLLAATIGIYIATVKSSSDTIKAARLNYDVDSVMLLMTNDIRRSGFWGGAIAGSDAKKNPFTVVTGKTTAKNFTPTDITIQDYAGHAGGCVLYSYDADGDGHYDGNADGDLADDDSHEIPPNVGLDDDRDEFYGFRLGTANGVGVIQMRKSGTTTDDADCTEGDWEAITVTQGHEAVDITALTFSLANSKCLNVSESDLCSAAAPVAGNKVSVSRELVITLTARLGTDSSVVRGSAGSPITQTIKLRNDRLYTQ